MSDDLKIKVFHKQVYGDVLIVEDDKDIAEVVESYLKAMDCFRTIVKAYDGIEAGMKLSRQKFCLILLDLNLPKRTGEELLEIIQQKSDYNKLESVVIMSGTINARKLEFIRSVGVTNFLVKPFDQEKFNDRIEDFLADKPIMRTGK